MVKYGSIERQYMTGGVGMIQVTLIIRITLVLAFPSMSSFWSLASIRHMVEYSYCLSRTF